MIKVPVSGFVFVVVVVVFSLQCLLFVYCLACEGNYKGKESCTILVIFSL